MGGQSWGANRPFHPSPCLPLAAVRRIRLFCQKRCWAVTQAVRPATAGSPWTPSSRDVPASIAHSWSGQHAHQQHPHQQQHATAPAPLAVLRTEHVASSPRAGGQTVQSPLAAGQQPFYQPTHQQQWQPPPHVAHLQTQQHFSLAGFHPSFAGQGFHGPGRPFAMPSIGPQHGFNPAYPMMDFQRQASLQGSQGPWPNMATQQPSSPQVRAGLPPHPGFFSPVPAPHQQQQGMFGHDGSPAPPQQPQHGVFGHVPPPGWQPPKPPVPGATGHPPPVASAQAPQQPVPAQNAPQHTPEQQQSLRSGESLGSAGSSGSQPAVPVAGSESGKLLLSMLQRHASSVSSARSTASAPSMQSTPSAAVPPAAAEGSAGPIPAAPSLGPDASSAAHAAARAAVGGRRGGRQYLPPGRGSPAVRGTGLQAGRQGGGRGGALNDRASGPRGGGRDAGRHGRGSGRHAPKVVPV